MLNNKRLKYEMKRVCQKGMKLLDLDLTVLKSILNFTNVSRTFLMSTSNRNDFQLWWKVMATSCFISVGVLALKKYKSDARNAL